MVEVLGTAGEVLRTIAVGFRDVTRAPGPMQPGAVKPCRNPGGPWIERSRVAAIRYEERRAHLVAAMDCDLCHGRAIAFRERFADSAAGVGG